MAIEIISSMSNFLSFHILSMWGNDMVRVVQYGKDFTTRGINWQFAQNLRVAKVELDLSSASLRILLRAH